MMVYEFKLGLSYTTIAIIQPDGVFNMWNDTHVSQGFSWRLTSVSFGTLSDHYTSNVSVRITDGFEINEKAIRIITVPFLVLEKKIFIASIGDEKSIEIDNGLYEVVFCATPHNDDKYDKYDFIFYKNEKPQARIIRADEELNPPATLLMEAEPAI